jgi:hypothetical protein
MMMSWIDSLEQNRRLLMTGLALAVLAVLAVTAMRNPSSYDAFWHLQMGKSWIEEGLVPWIDHFSFTFHGQEIVGAPILFQVLLHFFVSVLGIETGMQALKFSGYLIVVTLMAWYLLRMKSPVILYLLVIPALVVALQHRAMLRPEILSYGLSVIAMMLYLRAGTHISLKGMWPIVVLMAVWTNSHSPIFGYVIFFGLFVDFALRQIQDRSPVRVWTEWLAWGLAVFAVGFANPNLSHPVWRRFQFSPEWKEVIGEYRSIAAYSGDIEMYLLGIFTLLTLALLVWQKKWGHLIVSLILLYVAIDMSRLVTPFGIVMLCMFSQVIVESRLVEKAKRWPSNRQALISGACVLLVGGGIWLSVGRAAGFMEENRITVFKFPSGLVDYMEQNDISGNIFNIYRAGGYLIYRLGPETQVYIDGRTDILYPYEHFERWKEVLNHPDELKIEVEKYDINLALLYNTAPFYALMDESGLFELDYVGPVYSLFKRGNGNFPLLGKIYSRPECWRPEFQSQLQAERDRASRILPPYSPAHRYFALALDGKVREESGLSEEERITEGDWLDSQRRFAGFQAVRDGHFEEAFESFREVRNKVAKDWLAGALSKIHMGDWQEAEVILDEVSRFKWTRVYYVDMLILHALLNAINTHATLEIIEPAYIGTLGQQLNLQGPAVALEDLGADTFCTD